MKTQEISAAESYACWWNSAELAGHGKYRYAEVGARKLQRSFRGSPAWTSLGYSLYASHLRQQGQHARALHCDGWALNFASRDYSGEKTSALGRLARHDAYVGAAADHLGLLQFAKSRKLLDAAKKQEMLWPSEGEGIPDWVTNARLLLRRLWVECELALFTDDPATKALASDALKVADTVPSKRLQLKTALIYAVAHRIPASELSGLEKELLQESQWPLLWALYSYTGQGEKMQESRQQWKLSVR